MKGNFLHVFELTKELVNMESVTGNESRVAHYLRDYLQELKFETEFLAVSGDRANLWAWHGTPNVVMSTHMDTVPPYFPASEDENNIYGRGSCDAKGVLASQIGAAEKLLAEGTTNFGLLYLVGEETTSEGARKANQAPPGSRYMVNGEPTNNRLALGTKGALRIELTTQGRMAHSAYPHLGESAIEKLLDILLDFRKMNLPQHPVMGKTTYTIGLISGGRAANVIPDRAQAQILFRVAEEGRGFRENVEKLIGDRAEIEVLSDSPMLLMETLDGFDIEAFPFCTDLPWLSNWGKPLLIGPGSVSLAHTKEEAISKKEILQAVDLYAKIVRRLNEKIREGQ